MSTLQTEQTTREAHFESYGRKCEMVWDTICGGGVVWTGDTYRSFKVSPEIAQPSTTQGVYDLACKVMWDLGLL